MNYTISANSVDPNVFIYEPSESLTTIGIFASSIILSTGAFISQIISTLQKSKCSQIKCLGSNCIRNIEV